MKKFGGFLFCIIALVVGLAGGFYALSYLTIPNTDVVNVTDEIFYSNNPSQDNAVDLSEYDEDISVHFLELGNKYTGDCTYIKTDTADILIDCGSKSNSIATVSSYLKQYVLTERWNM